jgi:uncharacterized membrane protein
LRTRRGGNGRSLSTGIGHDLGCRHVRRVVFRPPTRLSRKNCREIASYVLAVLGASVGGLRGSDGDLRKIGVENVNSDFATFIRTIVILTVLGGILAATREFQSFTPISGRSYLFLILSGIATGASWICYFRALKLGDAARVAPIDKLSVVLVAVFGVGLPQGASLVAELARRFADRGGRCSRRLQRLRPRRDSRDTALQCQVFWI